MDAGEEEHLAVIFRAIASVQDDSADETSVPFVVWRYFDLEKRSEQ